MEAGYKDDEIFLLSEEEYGYYGDVIPNCNSAWWLRSPSSYAYYVRSVISRGSVFNNFANDSSGVRPAMHFKNGDNVIGSRLIIYDFPWACIDTGLAIAEVPIATYRFDWESNDYETSEIRQFLEEWRKSR